MQKQENEYLDGFLNLEHYSELELNKKQKMNDDTVGVKKTVSGLTNVSPQSQNSTVNTWAGQRKVQQKHRM